MAEELDSVIEQNAAGPKQASADGVTVQQHSLPDQIAADKHLASKRAMSGNPAAEFPDRVVKLAQTNADNRRHWANADGLAADAAAKPAVGLVKERNCPLAGVLKLHRQSPGGVATPRGSP